MRVQRQSLLSSAARGVADIRSSNCTIRVCVGHFGSRYSSTKETREDGSTTPTRAPTATGPGKPASRAQHATNSAMNEYALLREKYDMPKYPIVLAHGLLGFDELRLLGPLLPGVQYWRGIREALTAAGATVITAAVGPLDTIEQRAKALASHIRHAVHEQQHPDHHRPQDQGSTHHSFSFSSLSPRGDDPSSSKPTPINIIAHSMGGLDARYLISHLNPPDIQVKSLTTIATPHRGSAMADYVLDDVLGPTRVSSIYGALQRIGIPTGAWQQLTRRYMCGEFNPSTPDRVGTGNGESDGVEYYSFGAEFRPAWFGSSAFYASERIIRQIEGPNDGLVSVESSKWGNYMGTLQGVSHLDLINWTNRLKWIMAEMGGKKRSFNAVALYLGIADMLAKEGF